MKSSFFQNIYNTIKLKEVEVVSFDFFDTLMSRKVPHPKDIFWIMATKMTNANMFAFPVSPERFQALRIQAEEKARQEGPTREISIDDIYRQFPKELFKVSTDELIELEIETEEEFLFPILEIKEAMELAHHRGKKIIIVSDIYLKREHLERLWGPHTPKINIQYFVSSEYKTGKYDELFDIVLKKLKKKPEAIVHIGDNYISDIHTPSTKGLKACFIPHGSNTFWNIYNQERSSTTSNDLRISRTLGDLAITTLRCKTMLNLTPADVDTVSFIQYGAQVLGPVFAPFIHWVKSTCAETRVDVVVPLMREGHMIHNLITSYPEIYSRPAYLSRRVLFQSGLIDADIGMLTSLRFGNLDSTIRDYLELIGLFMSDVPNFAGAARTPLSNDDVFAQLIEEIANSPTLLPTIRSRSIGIRQGVVQHFKDLITLDGTVAKKIALVDVGWNGTIQKLLIKLLKEEQIETTVVGLYMMTTPSVNDLMFDGIMAKGFFVDGGYPQADFQSLSRTLEIFEQCCSPSHGTVLRHDVRTGEPVLRPDLISPEQRADIDDVQAGIMLFHQTYRNYVSEEISSADLSFIGETIRPILRRAMLTPSQQEALLFSSWMHDDNLASGAATPIMGTEQSQTFAAYKTIKQHMDTPMSELYWPAGALAINDPARVRMLSLSAIHQLALDEFDCDMALSSEIAVDHVIDGRYSQSFDVKDHQHLYQNTSGNSYLRFQVPVDDGSVLRWTPMAKPFDLHIAFIIFSFQTKNGYKASYRVDGEHAIASRSIAFGMDHYDRTGWRGPGEGSAFYFRDLRSLGVIGKGMLTIEIACRLNTLEKLPQRDAGAAEFTATKNTLLKAGHSLVETFNDKQLEDQTLLASNSGEISLSGWMIDPEFTKPRGKFFMRMTNSIGETQFIPMTTVRRPELARELKKEHEFGPHVDFGFSLKNYRLPAGKYVATVIRKDQDAYLIGKDSLNVLIESTR